ncbi:MAG: PH domain-containing protein [Pseudonocardiales bacterium]|nr:PH domain-containing protein [Pseudonocardiales bacterium]
MKSAGVFFETRPRKARHVAVAAAVVLVVVFTVVAVLLRRTPTGVYFRFSDQVAMVLLGLLLGGAALLFARPRVRAVADGVEVRNVLTTRTVPWDLVLQVSFPEGAPWARLELPDDEYIAVMAIQAADGQYAVQAMHSLRAVHAERTASSSIPEGDT